MKKTALLFVEAINAHDTTEISRLMAADFAFVDAYGHTEAKAEMETGWPAYFAWFPDYTIEIEEIIPGETSLILLGYAGGTYLGKKTGEKRHTWRIPAAWRVRTAAGQVTHWQVYADSKLPYEAMNP
ncbi:MAG: nuclear transport factor 2 family protein [Christensenellaceae bacterium]|jgi:ketosteroid isomerase-like protein